MVVSVESNKAEKAQTLPAVFDKDKIIHHRLKLSWTHYLFLIRLDNENERLFYEI